MGQDIAIVGLGVTRQGIKMGVSDVDLRRQALELALNDAGVGRDAIDGYVHAWRTREDLRYIGLSPNFSWPIDSGGASAIAVIQAAAGALATGQADMIACVFGIAPTSGYVPGLDVGTGGIGALGYGYPAQYGMIGAASAHALHARWHMDHHGTTSEQLGAVAVALRAHAAVRPDSINFGKPITLDDHQASRIVVDPFHLLDCCRDTDGGVALIVTSVETARSLGLPHMIQVRGLGFGHNIGNWHDGTVYAHHDDIAPAARRAFKQAGVGIADIDVASFYDPFTISVIMQLEHYGFCPPGQGGAFVEDGGIAMNGAIPVNTGGGQLSGFYAAGFTPVVEAMRQLRGEAGATQIKDARLALVSGHGLNGGIQNSWSHGTMILERTA